MAILTRNLTSLNDTGYQPGSWLPASSPMFSGFTISGAGIRFQNVTVPKNAVIASATVAFSGYAIDSGTTFGSAYGEASDNAPIWIDPSPLPDNVAKTTATITVPSTSPWTVTAIVQEIVNRAGWASGNALAFVTAPGGANGAVTWTNTATTQTVLTVVYNVGATQFNEVSQVHYSAAAWPYVFRGRQPYGASRLAPGAFLPPAVVNNPPFQNVGETSAQQAIAIAAAQPNPWGYNFPGGRQPYTPRRLPADIINNPPPFVPPDNPPFQTTGKTAQARAITQLWQPNPWVYAFAGASQPYTKVLRTPPTALVGNPPFRSRGKSSQILTAVWQWQPDVWPNLYFGARGPYAGRALPPVLIDVPLPDITISQKIIRNVVVRQRLVFGPGKEPGLQ